MAILTPELRQQIAKAGDEPLRVEDLETKTTYLIVREDVYRKLKEQAVIDHADPSLYEVGEFFPNKWSL
jgi:hypothetical protein